MFDEELYIELKELISTKEIKNIVEFISAVLRSHDALLKGRAREKFEVEDREKYLKMVDDFFEQPGFKNNKYLEPCFNLMFSAHDFWDLIAEKIDEMEYSEETKYDCIEVLNFLLGLSFKIDYNKPHINNSDETIDENESIEETYEITDSPEQEEYNNTMSDYLFGNLIDSLKDKIARLNNKDFLNLEFTDEGVELYKEIIDEKIDNMNESEFYMYLVYNCVGEELYSEKIIEKVKELNSPLIDNTYSVLTYSNYDKDKNHIDYLIDMRERVSGDFEEKIDKYKELTLDDGSGNKISVPDWNDENLKELDNNEEFKRYLNELEKLNDEEFIIFFYSYLVSNGVTFTQNENDILKARIRGLNDYDLETLYFILENIFCQSEYVEEQVKARGLFILNEDDYEYDENGYKRIKDEEIAEIRERILVEIEAFDYDGLFVMKPISRSFSNESKDEMEKAQFKYLDTIAEFEKCTDLQLMRIINQLNKTEKESNYYEIINSYGQYSSRIGLNREQKEKLSDEEIKMMLEKRNVELYKTKLKYQLIKYLRKRILSMNKIYLSMVDITNEDAIFNDIINIRLEEPHRQFEEDKNADENSK